MKLNQYSLLALLAASTVIVNGCSTMREQETPSTEQQPGTASSDQPRSQMSMAQMMDELALNELHHINQKEIMMSEMAERKAQSPQLKQQAGAIMADHKALESQVKAAAEAQKVELGTFTPSTFEKSTMDRLDKLSDAQFDQAFMRQLTMSHQMAAKQLKLTRSQVTNPLVARLINQTMPKITQHSQMIKQSAGIAGDEATLEQDTSPSTSSTLGE